MYSRWESFIKNTKIARKKFESIQIKAKLSPEKLSKCLNLIIMKVYKAKVNKVNDMKSTT